MLTMEQVNDTIGATAHTPPVHDLAPLTRDDVDTALGCLDAMATALESIAATLGVITQAAQR